MQETEYVLAPTPINNTANIAVAADIATGISGFVTDGVMGFAVHNLIHDILRKSCW